MSRCVQWLQVPSDATVFHQEEALNTLIYLLHQTGPTGFLLKEEGLKSKYRVNIGDRHSCTCSVFTRKGELCKHILWVILKKFRVPKEHPVSWQNGLVEREIEQIVKSSASSTYIDQNKKKEETNCKDHFVERREVHENDICPICQDALLRQSTLLSYCRYGCGNNIHLKCMKEWAKHQKISSEKLTCPMCREYFGDIKDSTVGSNLKSNVDDHHLGTFCPCCYETPIKGKCYKCSICVDLYLCQKCFNSPFHKEHGFNFRQKSNQRWRQASRMPQMNELEIVSNAIGNREFTENDYDLLLQLDKPSHEYGTSDLDVHVVSCLPTETVIVNEGSLSYSEKCILCKQIYNSGDIRNVLPCKHKFHQSCIQNWLVHCQPTCPIDGDIYDNETLANYCKKIRNRNAKKNKNRDKQRAHSAPEYQRMEVFGSSVCNESKLGCERDSLKLKKPLTCLLKKSPKLMMNLSRKKSTNELTSLSQHTLISSLSACGVHLSQRQATGGISKGKYYLEPIVTVSCKENRNDLPETNVERNNDSNPFSKTNFQVVGGHGIDEIPRMDILRAHGITKMQNFKHDDKRKPTILNQKSQKKNTLKKKTSDAIFREGETKDYQGQENKLLLIGNLIH